MIFLGLLRRLSLPIPGRPARDGGRGWRRPDQSVQADAGISVELPEELKGGTAEAIGTLDADKRAEIRETIGMLTSNLEKIPEHGRRADGIVRACCNTRVAAAVTGK